MSTDSPTREGSALAPDDLILIELYAPATPTGFPGAGAALDHALGRLIWWEPRTWLLRAAPDVGPGAAEHLLSAAGGDGAVAGVAGGLARFRLERPNWRELLAFGASGDPGDLTPAPGRAAGFLFHHVPVRLDRIHDATIDLYAPASFAAHVWTALERRLRDAEREGEERCAP